MASDRGSGLGLLESLLMLVFGPVAAIVVRLAVTRDRVYRADASGALLSGDTVALASALRKIEAGTAELALAPDGRRTSVGHLMIAFPFRPEGFARLFLTHPPAGERIRLLEALAGTAAERIRHLYGRRLPRSLSPCHLISPPTAKMATSPIIHRMELELRLPPAGRLVTPAVISTPFNIAWLTPIQHYDTS